MLKRFSFSLAFVIAGAASLSAVQSGEWIRVAPAGSGFSIMMPGTPKQASKVKDNLSLHSLSVVTDISVYLVQYDDQASSAKIDSVAELIADRDRFVKGIEGKLIESKEISLDGDPGLEFSAENSEFTAKCRVYVSGNRVYMIGAAVKKPAEDSANVNKFLTSFAFAKSDSARKP